LLLVGFGVLATILKFAGFPLPPLLIGFILGGMLEDNFARSMQLYDGISFIWERHMTLGLLILAVILVILPGLRNLRLRAKQRLCAGLRMFWTVPKSSFLVRVCPTE
jgi:putative tricarboxylic transport membrane protein